VTRTIFTCRMKTKTAVLLSGALIALLLLARYVALSRAGLPLGWMLYLGLPITAGGVLFALRLINLGAGWGARDTRQPAPPIAHSYPEPPVPVSERFRELEALRAAGAISDSEYSAKRARLISEL
jgi:hypothetical protein